MNAFGSFDPARHTLPSPQEDMVSITGVSVVVCRLTAHTPWVNTTTAVDPTQTKGRQTRPHSFLGLPNSVSSYSEPFVCVCERATGLRVVVNAHRGNWGIQVNRELKEIRVFQLLTVF